MRTEHERHVGQSALPGTTPTRRAAKRSVSFANVLALLTALALCAGPIAAPSFAQSATGSLVARLDRSVISLDETVRLTVSATDLQGELDTAALEREFDVVNRSRSSQVDILNGVRRDRLNWVLELAPRRVGVFTVPPVSVGGVAGELLTLEVRDPPVGGGRDLFVEAEVDTIAPYVQAQVLLTLRVFQAVDILEGALAEPSADGLDVQRLGDDTRRVEERDGRRYDVIERRFALFARASGTTVIPPIALEASLPIDPDRVRGFFAPSRRVVRRTAPITLDVRPRQAGTASWWLPAGALTVETDWLGDVANARVGQPLTRTVTVTAHGVSADRMPELDLPDPVGASIYAEAPETVSRVDADGIVTEQRLSWAIIPERPGALELPDVAIEWFDTASGEFRRAIAPATRIDVAPVDATGAGGIGTPVESGSTPPDALLEEERAGGADGAPAGSEASRVTPDGVALTDTRGVLPLDGAPAAGPWRGLTLIAVIGWALTAFAWWWSRRRLALVHDIEDRRDARPDRIAVSAGDVGVARADALAALSGEDLPRLETALIALGAAREPVRAGARSLTALARAQRAARARPAAADARVRRRARPTGRVGRAAATTSRRASLPTDRGCSDGGRHLAGARPGRPVDDRSVGRGDVASGSGGPLQP